MNKVLHIPVLIILVIGLYLVHLMGGDIAKNISISIGTSIIAAFIYAVVNLYFEKSLYDAVHQLGVAIESVKNISTTVSNIKTQGIIDVRAKYGEPASFWFSALNEASATLDMVGNSLGEWCTSDYRNKFKEHMLRILKSGGAIRIVIMNPVSDVAGEKRDIFGKNYKDQCERFKALVDEISAEACAMKSNGSLNLYFTAKHLTYMMIRNDEKMYISPYMTRKKAKHPIVAVISKSSEFFSGYKDDFDEIIIEIKSH